MARIDYSVVYLGYGATCLTLGPPPPCQSGDLMLESNILYPYSRAGAMLWNTTTL